MAQVSDYYLQLNDDGTPRRKHDIEDRDVRRPVFFSIAGFVFFNAFALLKIMWFGDDGASAGSQGRAGSGAQDVPQLVAGDIAVVSANEPGEAAAAARGDADAQLDKAQVRGSAIKFTLSPLDLNFSDTGPISTARLGAPLASASNDNLRLYGAAPGRPIILAEDGAGAGVAAGGGALNDEPDDDDVVDGSGSGPGREGTSGGGPGSGGSSSGPASNRLPVVSNVVILSALMINEARSLELADFLRHASDADGDGLTVANVKASVGHVVAKPAGGWLYIPEFNDRSIVEFTYEIKDGHGAVAQKAYLSLVPGTFIPLEGTDGDDDLAAAPIDELIAHIVDAGAGDDTVRTGSGDDTVYGSHGDDVISTGAGNDVVFAGDGDDEVDAGSGDDHVAGEGGHDHLIGGTGDDRLEGGDGNDVLWGGDGNDVLTGGQGEDVVDGGDGADIIFGEGGDGTDQMAGGAGDDVYVAVTGDGDDTFDGGDGNDVYRSAVSDGADVFHGGSGRDVFIAVEVGGGDTFDGGDGCDTYDASAVQQAVIIDLAGGNVYLVNDENLVAAAEEAMESPPGGDEATPEISSTSYDNTATLGQDLLVGVENAMGGRGDDVIIANDEVNELSGGAGDDTFVFQTVASTGSGSGSRDKILDFEVGDRIQIDDLGDEFERDFNDVFDDPGIRKFVLIAQGRDFAQPGEMRFKYDEEHDVTILEGNIDFNADTDFEIEIIGAHQLRYDNYVYST